jgi:hypothetical protein
MVTPSTGLKVVYTTTQMDEPLSASAPSTLSGSTTIPSLTNYHPSIPHLTQLDSTSPPTCQYQPTLLQCNAVQCNQVPFPPTSQSSHTHTVWCVTVAQKQDPIAMRCRLPASAVPACLGLRVQPCYPCGPMCDMLSISPWHNFFLSPLSFSLFITLVLVLSYTYNCLPTLPLIKVTRRPGFVLNFQVHLQDIASSP